MEFLARIVDFALHIDVHLAALIATYGVWTYTILFCIIFAETGLVVAPFFPGDSLLFAAGALAATGALNPWVLAALLTGAAILGDTVNYWIGYRVGPMVFHQATSRFFNKHHLERTHAFYEKYGGKTIIIARFMPIVRTFAPFVAGIGKMSYLHFVSYNVIGGILWVAVFVLGGYFFGNLPGVRHNFTLVILAIIILSILPPVIELLAHRFRRNGPPKDPQAPAGKH